MSQLWSLAEYRPITIIWTYAIPHSHRRADRVAAHIGWAHLHGGRRSLADRARAKAAMDARAASGLESDERRLQRQSRKPWHIRRQLVQGRQGERGVRLPVQRHGPVGHADVPMDRRTKVRRSGMGKSSPVREAASREHRRQLHPRIRHGKRDTARLAVAGAQRQSADATRRCYRRYDQQLPQRQPAASAE